MDDMVQHSGPPARGSLGRPPAFEADTVIAGAVELFWARGYEATSLEDVDEHLGIRRSTLYNSFGGKLGLYQSAVEAYLALVDERIFAPLRDGHAGVDDLVALLDRQRAVLVEHADPRGCLIVNAMITGENPEASGRYLARFQDAVHTALSRAADLGEVDPATLPMLTATFRTMVFGAMVSARSGATREELDEIFGGLTHTIRTWTRSAQSIGG
jgi:TetR/AcrR family transcriptional repressor of nem operon